MAFNCIILGGIGNGEGHTIKDWLELCFSIVDLNWLEYVEVLENFTPEYARLISDPKTMFKLGWYPKTSFEELARLMIGSVSSHSYIAGVR